MIATKTFQNWQVKTDAEQIVWLALDVLGSVNKITFGVLHELAEILTSISEQNTARAVVIYSAKQNGFIAGADIEEFTKINDSAAALKFINRGHAVFDQLAALQIPTIAMIQGFCLGGGLELALACRYRVAEDSAKTKLGLPEILLGLHPGWGGSVRLPRLIGALQAMELILTGRAVSARAAAKMGFVDAAVPERELLRAAHYYATAHPKPHQPTFIQALTNHSLVRPMLANILRKKAEAKADPKHYPAPYAVIENWENEGVDSDHALTIEAESLGRIAVTETAKNLIRVFFLQDRLKGLAKGVKFAPLHVHVIGAGTMGGDIAAWCALRGLQVTLQDREAKFIAPAIKRAYDLYKKKLKTPREIQAVMDRLTPDPDGIGIAKADVIIEAIFENLEVKRSLFKDIEKRCKPDAILATNTSSIPLDEINVVLKDPARLVGIHFFNPVAMMQLVEVVSGTAVTAASNDKAIAFVRRLDRLPLPVKSHPGFLVNRVLMPYLMEAMVLLEDGYSQTAIDKAAKQFGMPMGPIELADAVGLDVCLAVAKNLSGHFGGTVPERLEKMVGNNELGRKTGKGFYEYKNGKPVKEKEDSSSDSAGGDAGSADIIDRLILRMLNEAVTCLREGVVADADLVDAGMIFGTGFAPFRGGPMNYAKTRGITEIVARLNEFVHKYGERFKPDTGWNTI